MGTEVRPSEGGDEVDSVTGATEGDGGNRERRSVDGDVDGVTDGEVDIDVHSAVHFGESQDESIAEKRYLRRKSQVRRYKELIMEEAKKALDLERIASEPWKLAKVAKIVPLQEM